MHKCKYDCILRRSPDDGKPELCHIARWRDLELMVMRQGADGKTQVRNLFFTAYGGYHVAFPGEKELYYGTVRCEEWGERDRPPPLLSETRFNERHAEIVLSESPEFKYTLAVLKESGKRKLQDIFAYYQQWLRHREVEFLVKAGFHSLVFKEQFYRMKDKRRVVALLRSQNDRNVTMKEIQVRLKYGLSEREYRDYRELEEENGIKKFHFSYPEIRFLMKKAGANIRKTAMLYRDLKKMLIRLKKTDDDYWHYPKDIRKAHDKVVKMVSALERLEKKKEREKLEKEYRESLLKIPKPSIESGAFSVYIPQSLGEWDEQAETLHQCILTASYHKKMAKGDCVIVFVRKAGKPCATYEISPAGKVVQFYADELDRENCKPDEATRAIFDEWLALYVAQRKKKEHKKEA